MKFDGIEGLFKLGLGAVFGMAVLAGAANFPYRDPAGARDTLEKTTALQNIEIKDSRAWFGGCGSGDFFKTKFKAVNEKGQPVEGIVCKGILKGSTIRYW
ncbi:MAG: hypothetical protein EPN97_02465 [Alphaproteobacteria bacterium]|nr:MAG: hypothetical protein EPN97_02465 [Alphaproteobacteria bacterium]